MFVLKIKAGENEGRYVSRSGHRASDWKFVDDIKKARIFLIQGSLTEFLNRFVRLDSDRENFEIVSVKLIEEN